MSAATMRFPGYMRCGCGCWHECDEDGVFTGPKCWYQRRELWRRERRKKGL